MRLVCAFFLLICLLMPSVPAADKDPITEVQLVSKGKKRTFFLFVPPGLSAPAPLLITIQGKGRDAKKSVEVWKELATKEGIIVASPVASDRSGWRADQDGPDLFRQVVEAIKSKGSINARKIYIFGGHDSAPLGLALALIDSQFYAATVGYAGALDTFSFRLIDNAERRIPVGIVVGRNDPFFSLEAVRAFRDMLNTRSFPFDVIELAGHDNDYKKGFAVVNQATWDFLRQHELPEAR